jgi:RNA polymerase sigma-70 factor, ECF subfamily
MSNLSADHREILDLVYYQEKSIEDCALILGIPAATVNCAVSCQVAPRCPWT